MDWSHYSVDGRSSSKIYEEPYISSWILDESQGNTEAKLIPGGLEKGLEKARYIDCKNSNKYNITQTIAETFGVYCTYEYECDEHGHFLRQYYKNGELWTGRKVVFYNRAIKTDDPFYVEYQNNLSSINRTSDSTEIYTKLYVTPIQSTSTETGYITIADTEVNPLLDDFILNFDYLYNRGSISDYQMNFIKTYEVAMHKINSQLINLSPELENLTVEVNDAKAKIKSLENEIKSAEETLVKNQDYANNPLTESRVEKGPSNSYPITFVKDEAGYAAKLKLDGIEATSIRGYSDYTYKTTIFPDYDKGYRLITTTYKRVVSEGDNNFYILLDDYGFPCEIFASTTHPLLVGGNNFIYLSFTYSPKNAYMAICTQLQKTIDNKLAVKRVKNISLQAQEQALELCQEQYDKVLEEKTTWNNKLELTLGPALREGYWTPESYEDPGQKMEKELFSHFQEYYSEASAQLIFDDQYFSSEETGYYFDSAFDVSESQKYYSYIPITTTLLNEWEGRNLEDLVIHLKNPTGTGTYLEERLLYENAGFIFAFIKSENQSRIIPVLLLNNTTIDYDVYQSRTYSFQGTQESATALGKVTGMAYTLYYPRIAIFDNHVNYLSDNLKIYTYRRTPFDEVEGKLLTKYEDYSVLTRHGKPYFTLKITDTNTLSDIINGYYYIKYQLSRANEMLYLDAKQVARDNSQPRYSYELEVSNLPENIQSVELGQLVYINDHSLGIHAATGYISGIKLALDRPQDDELVIQNYKTKFEDLFSTITASSEAIKNNQVAYDIAAGGFTPNGQIAGSVLQDSINNNNVSFNYSNTNVVIDPDQGIILTNTSPYMNGVYGQVALRGGGIFLSDSIDAAGGRIWSTGITPSGINASLLSAGQIDTEKIRVFAGNNMAFQWNGEGIFAYKRDESGIPDMNSYVKYSDKGLQYVEGDRIAVDLGWNGLLISTQDGSTELTGKDGLIVYYGEKNDIGDNYAVRIGKFEDTTYGMRLYKRSIDGEHVSYVPTLVTSNNGELWLQDSIRVGNEDNGVGITGAGISEKDSEGNITYSPVRFWAGGANKEYAPFWVREDGSFKATKATIAGNITAIEGSIGGWIINEESLISPDEKTILAATGNERINVNKNFIVYSDGHIEAKSGKIGGMEIGSLEQDLNDIIGDKNEIDIVLSSSRGTVAMAGESYITRFTATIYKGNIEFNETEYNSYRYYWECSLTNEDSSWTNLMIEETDEGEIVGEATYTTDPYYDYIGNLSQSTYIRCRLEKIISEGGESGE